MIAVLQHFAVEEYFAIEVQFLVFSRMHIEIQTLPEERLKTRVAADCIEVVGARVSYNYYSLP